MGRTRWTNRVACSFTWYNSLRCSYIWRHLKWAGSATEVSDVQILQHRIQNGFVRVIKSRRMRWVVHVASMGEGRGVYRVLVGKPEGKRPLGRPRRRWEDNNKMDLQEVGCWGMDWIELAQDRDRWRALVSTVMSLRVP